MLFFLGREEEIGDIEEGEGEITGDVMDEEEDGKRAITYQVSCQCEITKITDTSNSSKISHQSLGQFSQNLSSPYFTIYNDDIVT